LANVGHPSDFLGVFEVVEKMPGKSCGIPHLAKNERDAPNFLHAALEKTACAPFFKERRVKFAEPTTAHRKSGVWGTRDLLLGKKGPCPVFSGILLLGRSW
jgi:hypothetical protein